MKILTTVFAVACMALAGTASAAERNDPARQKPAGATSLPAGIDRPANVDRILTVSAPAATAVATNALVALVYDPDVGIVRSKNVVSIRLPAYTSGLYCVRAIRSIRRIADQLVPAITPDFSPGPKGNNLYAYYRSGACRRNEIGVQTARDAGGGPILSPFVGFTMIVP